MQIDSFYTCFQEADRDGDGQINYEEFCVMMNRFLQSSFSDIQLYVWNMYPPQNIVTATLDWTAFTILFAFIHYKMSKYLKNDITIFPQRGVLQQDRWVLGKMINFGICQSMCLPQVYVCMNVRQMSSFLTEYTHYYSNMSNMIHMHIIWPPKFS